MGRGASIKSSWSRAAHMQLGSSPNDAMWTGWFFSEDSWPLGQGTYRIVGTSLTNTLALAGRGDIVVLPAGIYMENVTVPEGVTLRSAACATVMIVGRTTLTGNNTLRGITFRKGALDLTLDWTTNTGNFWFDRCTFSPEGSLGTFAEACPNNLTFNRCLFTDAGISSPTTFMNDGTGGTKRVTFQSCIFTLETDGARFDIVDFNSLKLLNNTIVVKNATSPTFQLGDQYRAGPPSVVARNLIVSREGNSGGIVIGSHATQLTAQYNYTFGFTTQADGLDLASMTLDSTNVNNVMKPSTYRLSGSYLVDLTNRLVGPRNETPGHTTVSRLTLEAPRVDYYGFAFEDDPSIGAIQWQYESSALYRPRHEIDLLTGFGFSYDYAAGSVPDATMLVDATYESPRSIACFINDYVQDVTHPSRGSFFVSYDGQYRLVTTDGAFDLDLTGDAATLLGTFDQSHIYDTGV